MILKKELNFINGNYFHVIRITDDYVEVMSKNTGHCWIIKQCLLGSDYPYLLYHKHKISTPYYHKHQKVYTFLRAIQAIKSHDKFVISSEKQKTNKENPRHCSR